MNNKKIDKRITEIIELMEKNLDALEKEGKDIDAESGIRAIIDKALMHMNFCGTLHGVRIGLQGKYLSGYISEKELRKLRDE